MTGFMAPPLKTSPLRSLPDLIQHEALAIAATTTVAADGYLLTVDWKEDEHFDLIEALANQRRQKGTPSSQPACASHRGCAQGLSLVSVESGADTEIIGIASCADLEQLRVTLDACGRRLWLDVALSEDDGKADETDHLL